MIRPIDYMTSLKSKYAQESVEALRLLDMAVYKTYCRNKSHSVNPDYEPRIVIYLGSYELNQLISLKRNAPELTDGETYRDFPVIKVEQESHCRVFCLNPTYATHS
jgi:hypothetical protein